MAIFNSYVKLPEGMILVRGSPQPAARSPQPSAHPWPSRPGRNHHGGRARIFPFLKGWDGSIQVPFLASGIVWEWNVAMAQNPWNLLVIHGSSSQKMGKNHRFWSITILQSHVFFAIDSSIPYSICAGMIEKHPWLRISLPSREHAWLFPVNCFKPDFVGGYPIKFGWIQRQGSTRMASRPAFPKLLMIRACDAETGSGGVGPATATVLNVVEKKKSAKSISATCLHSWYDIICWEIARWWHQKSGIGHWGLVTNLQQITCWGWSESNHDFPETSSAWRFVSMPIEFSCSWLSTKTLFFFMQHFSAPLSQTENGGEILVFLCVFFSCSNNLPPSRWKEDNYARRPA